MPKNTTFLGVVGVPTPTTIANGKPSIKLEPHRRFFDHRCDGDDFEDMVSRGLPHPTAHQLRRIARGLAGIREITKLFNVFDAERQVLADLAPEESNSAELLSPRSSEGVLRGIEVLADLLNQEVYALGGSLAEAAEGDHRE